MESTRKFISSTTSTTINSQQNDGEGNVITNMDTGRASGKRDQAFDDNDKLANFTYRKKTILYKLL